MRVLGPTLTPEGRVAPVSPPSLGGEAGVDEDFGDGHRPGRVTGGVGAGEGVEADGGEGVGAALPLPVAFTG